jgi:hypothetical protein
MAAIDNESAEIHREAAVFVLYTPENESQDLTLLFVQYLLRAHQQKIVYLGVNTAISDLKDACDSLHPDFVFTILQEPLQRQSVQSYVDQATQAIGASNLLLTGAQLFVSPVKLPANASILNGLSDTMQFLDQLQIRQRNGRL